MVQISDKENVPAAGAPFWTPAQDPPIGSALDPATAPTLFQPLQIRGMKLHNRFVVSPMCMYSAPDGHHTDFHFAHLSQFILRGNALTFVEATSVLSHGRITPEDAGLWKDSQIAPFKRIVDFAHSQGQKMGIQLAHAGRKASTIAPWLGARGEAPTASVKNNGWPDDTWGPSTVPFSDSYPSPKEMTLDDIKTLIQAFKDATKRALTAGFDVIEIHGAHGYLLTSFLSPLSNKRTDQYGGSLENRSRLLFEIIAAVRGIVPEDYPVFVRLSTTEWMEYSGEPSLTVEESIEIAKRLPEAGVDLLDCSTGGNSSAQKIDLHPYYQVDIAERIRDELRKDGKKILIGAVGMITNYQMADDIINETKLVGPGSSGDDGTVEVEDEQTGAKTKADVIIIARQLLREPEFPLRVAHKMGVPVKWPIQYHRAEWKAHDQIS